MGYQCIDMYQEITISSLDEIYQIIQEYKSYYNLPRPGLSKESPCLNGFYRGQSNCEWVFLQAFCDLTLKRLI